MTETARIEATITSIAQAACKMKANAEANGIGSPSIESCTATIMNEMARRQPERTAKIMARMAANGFTA